MFLCKKYVRVVYDLCMCQTNTYTPLNYLAFSLLYHHFYGCVCVYRLILEKNLTYNIDITNHMYKLRGSFIPSAFALPSLFVRSKNEQIALKQQQYNDRSPKYQRTKICNQNYKPIHRIDVNITFFKSFWHKGFHPYCFYYITI